MCWAAPRLMPSLASAGYLLEKCADSGLQALMNCWISRRLPLEFFDLGRCWGGNPLPQTHFLRVTLPKYGGGADVSAGLRNHVI